MKIVNRVIEFNGQTKLLLSTGNSFRIVEIDQIAYLKGWGGYTEIYLTNNKKIVTTTGLNIYEELLATNHFFRINKQINLSQSKPSRKLQS